MNREGLVRMVIDGWVPSTFRRFPFPDADRLAPLLSGRRPWRRELTAAALTLCGLGAIVWLISSYTSCSDGSCPPDNMAALMRIAAEDPTNPAVLHHIKRRLIKTPTLTGTYSLDNPDLQDFSLNGQSRRVFSLMLEADAAPHDGAGFFVEMCGCDGEWGSNSLFFEREKHWKGLMIEPDPVRFEKLRDKNRRAFTINADLQRGSGTRPSSVVPLMSMLLALNQTRVDYLSVADAEHREPEILASIPFDKLDIRMVSVRVALDDLPPDSIDRKQEEVTRRSRIVILMDSVEAGGPFRLVDWSSKTDLFFARSPGETD